MDTKTFHENFTVDRKARGVRANPKNAPQPEPDILTADGAIYDASQTYYFFDEQMRKVRQSTGLQRVGEHLSTFGLKIVDIVKLQLTSDDALTDGQAFLASEIKRLREQSQNFESEKSGANSNPESFLIAKE